ncbi:MAG TPA: DUF1501 domain-containing protein [Pirellulales bacterium]|nr:DUF1501 domain-containing protein [Pirellulales bacterium]
MNARCIPLEHLSRRALLKGSLAAAGGGTVLNLGDLFSSAARAEAVRQQQKRCILIWLNGGASQFETFDMKVGRPTGGPFREISTNVAGTRICELMPCMAQQMDKITVIRSMRTSQIDHPQGIHLMHTGYAQAANVRFPELGAVIAKYCGTPGAALPNFIKISSNGDAGSGFLGPQYQPFALGHDGSLPPFARGSLPPEQEARRNALRSFLEDQYAIREQAETSKMHREAYASARRLQSALDTFKIDEQWKKYGERYGDSGFGRNCLLARQLVEAGVPFVEVGHSGYDTHADNFTGHKGLVPPMDQAWAALLTDLHERGLLASTLVVWMGEIGRTPQINNRAGRDHYVRAWSTALAGCGLKGGLVYGETDVDGKDVKSNQVTEGDFFATIYRALGIDPKTEHLAGSRPIPIAPFGSKVVDELLA